MFSGMASLSLSSALWLTAMAANPLGAEIARPFGVEISFGGWLLAASVPTLTAMALLPLLLYRLMAPEVTATPEAPARARAALAALGPLRREEKIVSAVFVVMVALWALAATLALDSTAIAFLGLGVMLATGVLTGQHIAKEGDVLATYIWFAVLFTLSAQLNELGFMGFLGARLAGAMGGLPWLSAGLLLVFAYVLLHYLFVSQTAHLLALFGVTTRLPAPLRHQLLLRHRPAGVEREPAVCGQRLPDAGRVVPARRHHHRLQPCPLPPGGRTMARAGHPLRMGLSRRGRGRPAHRRPA
jgi:DASS family divalent anion:Na+ symporter